MKEIKNRSEVVERLAELMAKFEAECATYDIDIYAYYNDETGEVELTGYDNIGGNSWINDNHITLYTVKGSNCGLLGSEFYATVEDIADGLCMTAEELLKETIDDGLIDEDEEIEDADDFKHEICKYVKSMHSYMDMLQSVYKDAFDMDEIRARAEDCIAELETKINE